MDLQLKSFTCNRNLPIWIVENTFALTCNGNERCHFSDETIMEASGRIVMNGFEDYAGDDSMVMMQGGIDTMAEEFEMGQVVDLCKLNNKSPYDNGDDGAYDYGDDNANNNNADDDYYAANGGGGDDAYAANGDDAYAANGDDANANGGDDYYNAGGEGDDYYNGGGGDDYYNGGGGGDDYNAGNDDGAANGDDYYNNRRLEDHEDDDAYVDGCPEDGIYDFTTYMTLPNGRWRGTGWGANGYVDMYAHDGTLVGSCTMKFATPTTAWYIMPASVFWGIWVVVVAVGLFYVVFFVIRREMLCNNPCVRVPTEEPDGPPKDYKAMARNDHTDSGESSTDSESDRDLNDSGILHDYEKSRGKKVVPYRQVKKQFQSGVSSRVRQFQHGYTPRIRSAPVVQQQQRQSLDKTDGLLA